MWSYGARGIDHLVLCVRDLDAARRFYERLGFTLTPPARHPFGTGNALVQMKGCFLELLTVVTPQDIPADRPKHFNFAAYNRDFMARREGFSMLVFESSDAALDARGFAQRGLQTYPPFHFEREAGQPDGSTVTVAFSLAFLTDPRMPEAVFFTCHHKTPEHFWKPDYQRHVNGALTAGEAIMVADNPRALTGLFAGIQGPDSITEDEDGSGLLISGARGDVRVLPPAALRTRYPGVDPPGDPAHPHFVGYRIVVENLDRTTAILRDRDVEAAADSHRVWLRPDQAFGSLIEFVGQSGR